MELKTRPSVSVTVSDTREPPTTVTSLQTWLNPDHAIGLLESSILFTGRRRSVADQMTPIPLGFLEFTMLRRKGTSRGTSWRCWVHGKRGARDRRFGAPSHELLVPLRAPLPGWPGGRSKDHVRAHDEEFSVESGIRHGFEISPQGMIDLFITLTTGSQPARASKQCKFFHSPICIDFETVIM